MPEGDTIHHAARRIRPVLVGKRIVSIETPQPRFARRPCLASPGIDRWPERLRGRAVRSVVALGKNLLVGFEGGLTIYSHLRMGGWWGVFEQAERWSRSPRRAWLIVRANRTTYWCPGCQS